MSPAEPVAVWADIRQPFTEAVVQRLDHRVLKTRHHDRKPWLPTENAFRELQPIDLHSGDDHHLMPLENGPLGDGHQPRARFPAVAVVFAWRGLGVHYALIVLFMRVRL